MPARSCTTATLFLQAKMDLFRLPTGEGHSITEGLYQGERQSSIRAYVNDHSGLSSIPSGIESRSGHFWCIAFAPMTMAGKRTSDDGAWNVRFKCKALS